MGVELARAAVRSGCSTTLLLGPASLNIQSDPQLTIHRFQSTANLQALLAEHWPAHDLLIMAAAVADFRPASPATGKIRRTDGLTLTLEPTPDLLAGVASNRRTDQFIVGFALEPQETMLAAAGEKLARKRIDAIVANPLETMDAASVTGHLLLKDGRTHAGPPHASKEAFAQWLLSVILKQFVDRNPGVRSC